jgi:gas vesicle protein
MKFIKGLLAIAIISLIEVSCNDTKKGAKKDLDHAVEATKDAANDAVDATKDAAESVKETAKDVAESVEDTAKDVVDDVKDAAADVKKWIDREVIYPKDVKLQKETIAIKKVMSKANPRVGDFFGKAYGYAIFPKIIKGAFVVGGAGGKGLVFENHVVIGESTLMQATIGAQIGGQEYSEFILFKDKAALDRFKNKKFKFAGEISAVAWDKADSKNIDYQNGVAVYTYSNKGLMAEVSVGAQKFKYHHGIK